MELVREQNDLFFVTFILSERNFYFLCFFLNIYIVYWINFKNKYTFAYQKTLFHTINQSINQSINLNQSKQCIFEYNKMGWLGPIFGIFHDLVPHCNHSTTWYPDLWHCTPTLSIRKIHNFWSSLFLVFLVTTMRNCYSGNGVAWSYTGLEAHFTFSILCFFFSYFTAFKAWKIRQNGFPAIWTFKLHKKLLISLFKQRRG